MLKDAYGGVVPDDLATAAQLFLIVDLAQRACTRRYVLYMSCVESFIVVWM